MNNFFNIYIHAMKLCYNCSAPFEIVTCNFLDIQTIFEIFVKFILSLMAKVTVIVFHSRLVFGVTSWCRIALK